MPVLAIGKFKLSFDFAPGTVGATFLRVALIPCILALLLFCVELIFELTASFLCRTYL
jgi:hypothetical protein